MRTGLLFAFCLLFCELSCWAQADREKFKRDLYTPSVITTPSIDPERFVALSPVSRADLLSARRALVAFFVAVEKPDGDPKVYLAPSFSAKYNDISELIIKLLGQETTVMSLGVSDFSLHGDSIRLDFYIVLFAEGVTVAKDSSAELKKTGGSWKITQIGDLP
ncbi:MAG TPA: hypothetical protein VE422_04915 [Terriglobia bacterium]|nr:hypothetical protein [Terriglobia bacterium]